MAHETEGETMSASSDPGVSKAKRKRKPAKRRAAVAKETTTTELLSLRPEGEVRPKQEMFRVTHAEHNEMVKRARKGGFATMSDFFRKSCGL